jgi:LysM repeat protein
MLRHMTRENKLALVVGFGLILLVGILISDHFSHARMQDPADLAAAVDPLGGALAERTDLLALRTTQSPMPAPSRTERDQPEVTAAVPMGDRVRPIDPVISSSAVAIEMGGGPAGEPGVGLSPAAAGSLPYRYHHVAKNESLGSICRKYYADASLVDELARANGIEDPDVVPLGFRLRIPDADDLVRGRGGAAPASGSAPASERAAPTPRNVYTVVEGDNLSKIAKRLLGSSDRWTAIYEVNRDLLESPDDLRPGMTLTIPPRQG